MTFSGGAVRAPAPVLDPSARPTRASTAAGQSVVAGGIGMVRASSREAAPQGCGGAVGDPGVGVDAARLVGRSTPTGPEGVAGGARAIPGSSWRAPLAVRRTAAAAPSAAPGPARLVGASNTAGPDRPAGRAEGSASLRGALR